MYIDAYRLTMIGAGLIVLLVMYGGPDRPQFRIKTKEEKWLEGIEAGISGKNNGMISGLMGGGGGGNGMPPPGVDPTQSNNYYQYQQQLLREQSQQAYQADPRYMLRYPSDLGSLTPKQNNGLPYQQSPATNPYAPVNPVPGGAMGGTAGTNWSSQDAPIFPQAFPKWTSGPTDRIRSIESEALGGGQSRVDPRFILRSGQEVRFAGTKVYTKDEDGQMIPMPDGEYVDKTNSRTIQVRNGKRVLPSN